MASTSRQLKWSTAIGVGGGGRGASAPSGFGNLLKFAQMGWDIRAFGGRKKNSIIQKIARIRIKIMINSYL